MKARHIFAALTVALVSAAPVHAAEGVTEPAQPAETKSEKATTEKTTSGKTTTEPTQPATPRPPVN